MLAEDQKISTERHLDAPEMRASESLKSQQVLNWVNFKLENQPNSLKQLGHLSLNSSRL